MARIKAHLRRTETIETAAEESSNSGKQEISIGELIIVTGKRKYLPMNAR